MARHLKTIRISDNNAPQICTFSSILRRATGVNEVKEVNEVNDNSWYNLAGQRVAKPTRGNSGTSSVSKHYYRAHRAPCEDDGIETGYDCEFTHEL